MSASPLSNTPPAAPASTSVPASSGSRDRARSARRQAILEAAEAVFAERGFRGATMAEIASRAGYSAGNLYNVFENKEALFAEVLASRATLMLQAVHEAIGDRELELEALIDRYVDAILRFVRAHRGFFVIITQTHLDFDWHEAQTPGANVRARFDRALEAMFARAMERGELPDGSPRSYVCLLQGTLNSHLARWARDGEAPDAIEPVAGEIRTLIKRALGIGG